MNFKVNTNTVHERRHHAVLSQDQVEALLKDAVARQLDLYPGIATFDFRWGEESFDSGLRKRPQIIVTVTEDLSKIPTAAP